jgi:hypothetical protein
MRKKQVFISYCVDDIKLVEKIRKDLETAEIDVWVYPRSILPSDHIVASEEEGIRKCDKVLLMWSRASKASKPVKKEIELTRKLEKKIGRRKLIYCRIQKNMPLPRNEIHQACNLFTSEDYTSEFLRLLKIINQSQDYWLESDVSYSGLEEGKHWFKIVLHVGGHNMKEIIDVDYQLHSDIATSAYTDWANVDTRAKKFQIIFYSYDPEVVYCLIRLSDGSYEELRELIPLKPTR